MIYKDLIEFFLCKWDFSVSPFILNHYYAASTAKNISEYYIETDKDKFSVKKSTKRFDLR